MVNKEQKMYAFVYNTQTKKVSNLTRADFIKLDPKNNEINWNSYKDQLSRKSQNVKTYNNSLYMYLDFFKNNVVFVFGYNLTKELVAEICEIESNFIKCVVIEGINKYKFIPISKISSVCDKDDIPLIQQMLNKITLTTPPITFGCLEHKEYKGFFLAPKITDDFMKTFNYKSFIDQMDVGRKKAEMNQKQTGSVNNKKLTFVEKIIVGKTIKIMEKAIDRKLNDQSLSDAQINEIKEIQKQITEVKNNAKKGICDVDRFEIISHKLGEVLNG